MTSRHYEQGHHLHGQNAVHSGWAAAATSHYDKNAHEEEHGHGATMTATATTTATAAATAKATKTATATATSSGGGGGGASSTTRMGNVPNDGTHHAPALHLAQTLSDVHHHSVFRAYSMSMRDMIQASASEFRRVVERGATQAQLARAAIPTETETLLPSLGHTLLGSGHAGNLHWILSEQHHVPLADFYDHHHHDGHHDEYHYPPFDHAAGGSTWEAQDGHDAHVGWNEHHPFHHQQPQEQPQLHHDHHSYAATQESPHGDTTAATRHHDYPSASAKSNNAAADANTNTCHCVFLSLRGFDVDDPGTDTNQLAVTVVDAAPEFLPFQDGAVGLMVHRGFLRVARELYHQVLEPYVLRHKHADTKIVLTGHSCGGVSTVMLLLLLAFEKGPNYVLENVLRAYSFAAPQVARVATPQEVADAAACAPPNAKTPVGKGTAALGVPQGTTPHPNATTTTSATTTTPPVYLAEDYEFHCPILATIGLPPSMLYQYVQPWDTAPRLFSTIDPYYHAFEDVGADGVTLLASGSFRLAQRLLARKFTHWDAWPQFRDTYRQFGKQDYHRVGIQQLLLPHRTEYVTHNHLVPGWSFARIATVVRVEALECQNVLWHAFPLDSDSHIHTASLIRSFRHHFIPSYVQAFGAYVADAQRQRQPHDADESYSQIHSKWLH